jgi:hypothetical protein
MTETTASTPKTVLYPVGCGVLSTLTYTLAFHLVSIDIPDSCSVYGPTTCQKYYNVSGSQGPFSLSKWLDTEVGVWYSLQDLYWVWIISVFCFLLALQESYLPIVGLETLHAKHSVQVYFTTISISSNVRLIVLLCIIEQKC